jgi:serine phosphatase RsbU (regulator of sigma subunit)
MTERALQQGDRVGPGDRRAAGADPVAPEAMPVASRRAAALLALAALLLFAAVAGALAWRQYRDAEREAVNNDRTRAVLAANIFDIYFAGQIGTLTSIAKAPVVRHTDEANMLAYFKRVQPPNGKLFPGGLAWANLDGTVRVSTSRPAPANIANVSDRSYFFNALKSGAPYVSEGLTGRLNHQQVVATGVPTRNDAGEITGVLIGTLLIKPANPSQATFDLGYAGLAILDRRDQSILAGFVQPKHLAEPARFGKVGNGVLADTTGLDGKSGHVLAFARATIPQWTVILDRPRSEVFAAARHTLELEATLLGGVALLDLALLFWVFRRARAEARLAAADARRRRRRYEQEHQVATTLQRSLLAEMPEIDGIDAAARYQAGSTGLEVGGDWFDVLRRPDGIVQITVGDVAGRGVAAAALMGQLRNAFRAYAYEHASPAAVMSRLQRHIVNDEMATAICIAVDPYTREVAYASAGHPPPLLRDDTTGAITQLARAQSPLLGPVSTKPVADAWLELPRRATLVGYTDGMVERRDEVIDAGIDRLATALSAAGAELSAAELADRLIRDVAEVTAADDDIALLVLRFDDVPASLEMDLPADLVAFAEARRRVQIWLGARGVDGARSAEVMLAIGEALSDALERDDPGTPFGIHLQVVHGGDDVHIAVESGTVRTV